MANTSSAKKALRVSKRKRITNLRAKKAYKEAIKNTLKAKSTKKKELISLAYKKIDKAAKRNVLSKKKASRLKQKVAKN